MLYYGTRLSDNLSLREPEGYLLCLNVPVARTGTQDYLPEELGLPPASAPVQLGGGTLPLRAGAPALARLRWISDAAYLRIGHPAPPCLPFLMLRGFAPAGAGALCRDGRGPLRPAALGGSPQPRPSQHIAAGIHPAAIPGAGRLRL